MTVSTPVAPFIGCRTGRAVEEAQLSLWLELASGQEQLIASEDRARVFAAVTPQKTLPPTRVKFSALGDDSPPADEPLPPPGHLFASVDAPPTPPSSKQQRATLQAQIEEVMNSPRVKPNHARLVRELAAMGFDDAAAGMALRRADHGTLAEAMRILVDDAAAARRKEGAGDGGDDGGDAAGGYTPRGGWKSARLRNQLDAQKKAAEAQRRRAEAAAAQLESDQLRRKTVREAAERMADGGINLLWMRGQRRQLQEQARAAKANSAVAAREAASDARISAHRAAVGANPFHRTPSPPRSPRAAALAAFAQIDRELKHDFQ